MVNTLVYHLHRQKGDHGRVASRYYQDARCVDHLHGVNSCPDGLYKHLISGWCWLIQVIYDLWLSTDGRKDDAFHNAYSSKVELQQQLRTMEALPNLDKDHRTSRAIIQTLSSGAR